MAQQRNVFQLALSLSLLCWATPSQATPGQPQVPVDPAPGAADTPAIRLATDERPQTLAPEPVGFPSLTHPGSLPISPSAEPDPALTQSNYLTTAAALTSTPTATSTVAGSIRPTSPLDYSHELAQADANGDRDSAGQDDDSEPASTPDPELGVIQVRSLVEDTDLGILRIRAQPEIPAQVTQQPRPKIGFLTARLAIASSDNVLFAVNDVGGLTGDTFLRPSLGFALYPSLGPQTVFIGTADLGLQRYGSQSGLNYDDLRFRVGVRQGLTPRSYGQLTFTYQELFRPGGNRGRFFKNTALGLTLSRRDPITSKLVLDSYYLVQFNGAQSHTETFSGPITSDFSRLLQSAGGYLGYDFTPQLQAGLSYQLNLIDYTAQDRYDAFQQVLGQVVYRLSPTVRLSVYGGVSFGRSSEPRVQFNDTFFGATIDATIPLF
ncbi:MAG: hypothetical protein ACFCVB_20000 [Nodosilinea sp.]